MKRERKQDKPTEEAGLKASYNNGFGAGYTEAMERIKKILTDELICHNITISLLADRIPLRRGIVDPILEPNAYLAAVQSASFDPGMIPFYVYHTPSKTYTTIGAENIHHACNKATKEFHGEWTGLGRNQPKSDIWKFKTVAEFNKILKRGPEVPF